MFSEVFQMDKILGFCEKLWYVIGANLLFLLSNLPAILFFLFVGASQVRTCLPFFLLCMVPAGPALSALFYTMNRLLSKTETGVWRDYRKAYRDDWGQKYLLAAGHMFLILVFEINLANVCQPFFEFFSDEKRVTLINLPYCRFEKRSIKLR